MIEKCDGVPPCFVNAQKLISGFRSPVDSTGSPKTRPVGRLLRAPEGPQFFVSVHSVPLACVIPQVHIVLRIPHEPAKRYVSFAAQETSLAHDARSGRRSPVSGSGGLHRRPDPSIESALSLAGMGVPPTPFFCKCSFQDT